MKPKTILEKKVVELHKTLPSVTPKQREFILKFQDYYFTISKKYIYCLECGHKWRKTIEMERILEQECPECKNKLKYKEHVGYQSSWDSGTDAYYIGFMKSFKGFQVIRMYFFRKEMYKLKPAQMIWGEVMQHWISPDGKVTSMIQATNPMNYYFDKWIWEGNMEIRKNNSYRVNELKKIEPYKWYPYKSFIKQIKGIKHKTIPRKYRILEYYSTILRFPVAEHFLNTNIEMFDRLVKYPEFCAVNWKTIRVALRHKYKFPHWNSWMDLITALKYMKKDILNPFYICPEDFTASHDYWLNKAYKEKTKRNAERAASKLADDTEKYIKQKGRFFGLVIKNNDIEITPLKSVMEFYEIGTIQNHCIYSGEYYNKENSLIMISKANDGNLLETIEVDLKKGEVLQSRGSCNTPQKHHKKIVKLVEDNMNEIMKLKYG
jgi:hypothetical protein